MSLLDIFVIFVNYCNAEKHKTRINKITKQKFENNLIYTKLKEIENYHSSALHWNLKEINETFSEIIQKVKESYKNIGNQLGVEFHSEIGIDNFAKQFINGVQNFMITSRQKAFEAQSREIKTIQPNVRKK